MRIGSTWITREPSSRFYIEGLAIGRMAKGMKWTQGKVSAGG